MGSRMHDTELDSLWDRRRLRDHLRPQLHKLRRPVLKLLVMNVIATTGLQNIDKIYGHVEFSSMALLSNSVCAYDL